MGNPLPVPGGEETKIRVARAGDIPIVPAGPGGEDTKARVQRRIFLIQPKLQSALVLRAVGVVFVFIVFVGLTLWWSYNQMTLLDLPEAVHSALWRALVVTAACSSFLLFTVAVYFVLLSHRIAGPVYRLKKAMAEFALGRSPREIHLREGDFLQDVAALFNDVVRLLKRRDDRWMSVGRKVEMLRKLHQEGQGQSGKAGEIMGSIDEDLKALGLEMEGHAPAPEPKAPVENP